MENINDYKALAFFDLDGTLLNSQSKLDQEVIEGIHRIRENGVLPFIATGRGHFELDEIIENEDSRDSIIEIKDMDEGIILDTQQMFLNRLH